jgi:hypothetical protein
MVPSWEPKVLGTWEMVTETEYASTNDKRHDLVAKGWVGVCMGHSYLAFHLTTPFHPSSPQMFGNFGSPTVHQNLSLHSWDRGVPNLLYTSMECGVKDKSKVT